MFGCCFPGFEIVLLVVVWRLKTLEDDVLVFEDVCWIVKLGFEEDWLLV